MSDATPRLIEGLTPREAPLARLRASERAADTATTKASTPPAKPAAAKRPAPSKQAAAKPQAAPGRKPSMTFYAETQLQSRARAAFTQTRHLEGDESFSDMVAKALEAEVARREQLYNDGEPFSGGGPLPTGRPVQA